MPLKLKTSAEPPTVAPVVAVVATSTVRDCPRGRPGVEGRFAVVVQDGELVSRLGDASDADSAVETA